MPGMDLAACRSGESRLAQWSEIDEEAAAWVIPAERMKARRAHVVPLVPRCIEILREARVLNPSTTGSGLIFPSAKRDRPLSDMAMTKILRDLELAERATVHGFRSGFKVWAAEVAKVRDEVRARSPE